MRLEPPDGPGKLRNTLYQAAKAKPERRFHALYDKVYRRDVIEQGWGQVRRNRGAAGIDEITVEMVEEHGVERLLDELVEDLRTERYRPLPSRRVWIPKPGTAEKRPLSIPAVRDRIVQSALKAVIEPIFEADFHALSFGFRPGRGAHDANQVLLEEAWKGKTWVVESDVANCFEAIPHDGLMRAVEERIVDRKVLKLLRWLLRAGVMEQGAVKRAVTGTPQGGVISPLLCNVYLNWLDRQWRTRGKGVLIRYADDLVVMCRSEAEAQRALAELKAILGELGLEAKAAKTRIVHLEEGGEGFDFLGFHHRMVRGRSRRRASGFLYLARWPSRRATQYARDKIRDLTKRSRLREPLEKIVEDVNAYLRGWSGYFRYGNSWETFGKMQAYAAERLARFVANLHERRLSYGWMVYSRSPDRLGLLSLSGQVITPRPNRSWRGTG